MGNENINTFYWEHSTENSNELAQQVLQHTHNFSFENTGGNATDNKEYAEAIDFNVTHVCCA